MTDDDKIKAVTTTLTSEFFVGQRVQLTTGLNGPGTIAKLGDNLVVIVFDFALDYKFSYFPEAVRPLP